MDFSKTIFIVDKNFHEYTLLFPYFDGRKYNLKVLTVKKEDPNHQHQITFIDVASDQLVKVSPEPRFLAQGNISWTSRYVFISESRLDLIKDWIARLNG